MNAQVRLPFSYDVSSLSSDVEGFQSLPYFTQLSARFYRNQITPLVRKLDSPQASDKKVHSTAPMQSKTWL